MLNSFSGSFFDFYSYEFGSFSDIRKNKTNSFASKMEVDMNALNTLHVTSCEWLHFVLFYMNKKN